MQRGPGRRGQRGDRLSAARLGRRALRNSRAGRPSCDGANRLCGFLKCRQQLDEEALRGYAWIWYVTLTRRRTDPCGRPRRHRQPTEADIDVLLYGPICPVHALAPHLRGTGRGP
jgi:hypothetical protein